MSNTSSATLKLDTVTVGLQYHHQSIKIKTPTRSLETETHAVHETKIHDSRGSGGIITELRMRLKARSAAGGACWREDVEVDEPCTAVEFRVDGLDLP